MDVTNNSTNLKQIFPLPFQMFCKILLKILLVIIHILEWFSNIAKTASSCIRNYLQHDKKIHVDSTTATDVAIGSPTATDVAIASPTATDVAIGSPTATDVAIGSPTATDIAIGSPTATDIAIASTTANDIAIASTTATDVAIGSPTATDVAVASITGTDIAIASTTVTDANSTAESLSEGIDNLVKTRTSQQPEEKTSHEGSGARHTDAMEPVCNPEVSRYLEDSIPQQLKSEEACCVTPVEPTDSNDSSALVCSSIISGLPDLSTVDTLTKTSSSHTEWSGNSSFIADQPMSLDKFFVEQEHPTQNDGKSDFCISSTRTSYNNVHNPSTQAAETEISNHYGDPEHLMGAMTPNSSSHLVYEGIDLNPDVKALVNSEDSSFDDLKNVTVPKAHSLSDCHESCVWNSCSVDCFLAIIYLHLMMSQKLRIYLFELKERWIPPLNFNSSCEKIRYRAAYRAMLDTCMTILKAYGYSWLGEFNDARRLVCPGLRDMYGSEMERIIPFLAPTFLELFNNKCSSDKCFNLLYHNQAQLMINIAPELSDLYSPQGLQAAVDRYMRVDKRHCNEWRPDGCCTGTRISLRRFVAPPPFIPINMNGLNVTEDDIDPDHGCVNLNRKLTVDNESYQLAGIVFHRPGHFTAKIRIPGGEDKIEETFLHYEADDSGKLSTNAKVSAADVVPKISLVYYVLMPQ